MSSEFLTLDLSGSIVGGIYLSRSQQGFGAQLEGNQYQVCRRTHIIDTNCTSIHMRPWPRRGTRTFRDTKLAVGLFRQSIGYAPVQPTILVGMLVCQNSEEA